MNHKFLLISILLLIIHLISADRVGIVVSFPDGSVHGECLQANSGTNGYELLQKLTLPTLWAGPSSFGHMLCQINGVGQETDGNFCSFTGGKFWSFYILKDNKWKSSPVGSDSGERCWNGDVNLPKGDHYCVKDKDIIGFKFIEYGDQDPVIYDFNDICNPLVIKKVMAYVDGKKQSDADEKGGEIKTKPGSSLVLKIELENNYLFGNLEIGDINGKFTIKDINHGKDLEKEIKFKDLEVDENYKKELAITLPLILEEEDYEAELKINGNYGKFKQEIVVNYDLEINKEKNDLTVSKLELENEESCPNKPNKLYLEIVNIGKKQDSVLLSVKSSELNIIFIDNFKLEENSNYKKEINFVVPYLAPGDYKINLDYFDNLRENIIISVKNCDEQTQTTKNNVQMLGVKQASLRQVIYTPKSFFEIYAIPTLLGVFLVSLIAAIILIINILGKKSSF